MNRLDAAADRLETEIDHLLLQVESITQSEQLDDSHLELAVSQAKRVRRDATLILKLLAQTRDNLQS